VTLPASRDGLPNRRAALASAGAVTGLVVGGLVTWTLVHADFILFGGLGGVCWGALVGLDAPRSPPQVAVITALTGWLTGPVLGGLIAGLVCLVAELGP
jgi:hypothetical protein